MFLLPMIAQMHAWSLYVLREITFFKIAPTQLDGESLGSFVGESPIVLYG